LPSSNTRPICLRRRRRRGGKRLLRQRPTRLRRRPRRRKATRPRHKPTEGSAAGRLPAKGIIQGLFWPAISASAPCSWVIFWSAFVEVSASPMAGRTGGRRNECSRGRKFMPTDVVMPQMGESIFEGTITKWLRQPGERVERDQPLFEISTDKVDAEIPAPASGVLKEIKAQAGATVQVNSVVAVIDDSGTAQSPSPNAAPAQASRPQAVPSPQPAAQPPVPDASSAPAPPSARAKRAPRSHGLGCRPARLLRLSCRRWENPFLKAPSRAG